MNGTQKAKKLGAIRVQRGINWTWADFDEEKAARAFDKWCLENGYETRGVYNPGDRFKEWSVRFR